MLRFLATNDLLLYSLKMIILILFTLSLASFAETRALTDNILFAFEKCKILSVDLQKGLLKEETVPSFDIHCRRNASSLLDFDCDFYDATSSKKTDHLKFSGGSDLGVGLLLNSSNHKINFLIGKKFASFESGTEKKVCIGIYLFEKDALKKKASLHN